MLDNLKNATNYEEAKKIHLQYMQQRKQYMCDFQQYKKETMSETAKSNLKNYFQSDKEYIENILGRDLSTIWF